MEDLSEIHQRQQRERGYGFSEFEWAGTIDPEFERVRLAYVDMTYLRKNSALDTKWRELISALLLAMRGYHTAERHLRRALDAGLTVREALEAFQQASVPGGQATMHVGVAILRKLVEEEGYSVD